MLLNVSCKLSDWAGQKVSVDLVAVVSQERDALCLQVVSNFNIYEMQHLK